MNCAIGQKMKLEASSEALHALHQVEGRSKGAWSSGRLALDLKLPFGEMDFLE